MRVVFLTSHPVWALWVSLKTKNIVLLQTGFAAVFIFFVKEGETKWYNLTCFSCCRERLRCGSPDLAKGPSPLFSSQPPHLPHAAQLQQRTYCGVGKGVGRDAALIFPFRARGWNKFRENKRQETAVRKDLAREVSSFAGEFCVGFGVRCVCGGA